METYKESLLKSVLDKIVHLYLYDGLRETQLAERFGTDFSIMSRAIEYLQLESKVVQTISHPDIEGTILKLHSFELSSYQIAEACKVSYDKVRAILQKNNLKGNVPSARNDRLKEILVSLYESGMSASDIEDRTGVTIHSVIRYAKEAGVEIRTGHNAKAAGSSFRPEVINKLNVISREIKELKRLRKIDQKRLKKLNAPEVKPIVKRKPIDDATLLQTKKLYEESDYSIPKIAETIGISQNRIRNKAKENKWKRSKTIYGKNARRLKEEKEKRIETIKYQYENTDMSVEEIAKGLSLYIGTVYKYTKNCTRKHPVKRKGVKVLPLDEIKKEYETTDHTLKVIAKNFKISLNTINKNAKKYGWKRMNPPKRGPKKK